MRVGELREIEHVGAPVIANLKGVVILEKESEGAKEEAGKAGLQNERADDQKEGQGETCVEGGEFFGKRMRGIGDEVSFEV